jgi:hypothetical protein
LDFLTVTVRFGSGECKPNFQKLRKAFDAVSSFSMVRGMKIEKLSAKPDSFIKSLNFPISLVMREESDGEMVERLWPH